jgi:hypothetical protein
VLFCQSGQRFIILQAGTGKRHTLTHVGHGTWVLGSITLCTGQAFYTIPYSTLQAGAALQGITIKPVSGGL